jgi:hypothetical protein
MPFTQRKKVLKEIANFGIELKIPSHLPTVSEKLKKTAKDIAERITQLYSLVGLAEDEVDNIKIKKWLDEEGLFNSLDTGEKALFEKADGRLAQEDKVKLSWYREPLFVLAWTIHLVNVLPPPNEEVTLVNLFAKMPPAIPTGKFLANATLRNTKELLYQLDLYYCLHWLIVEYGEKEIKGYIKKNIVIDRRLALEWIFSNERWNDITLDT